MRKRLALSPRQLRKLVADKRLVTTRLGPRSLRVYAGSLNDYLSNDPNTLTDLVAKAHHVGLTETEQLEELAAAHYGGDDLRAFQLAFRLLNSLGSCPLSVQIRAACQRILNR